MTDLLDCADPGVRDELREIVAETLDGLVEAALGEHRLPEVFGHEEMVIEAALTIVGDDLSAQLVLRVPAPTAIALTAALTEEQPSALGLEDACGTVAELCNVIGGTVKTMFGPETALRVPTSHAIEHDRLTTIDVVEVPHGIGRFDVHLGD